MIRHRPAVLIEFRAAFWLLPYAAVWLAAWAAVTSLARGARCTGFCAVYVGSMTYTVLAIAVALTALIAATQLVLLSR